jgi:hypothetical protein
MLNVLREEIEKKGGERYYNKEVVGVFFLHV